MENRKVVIGIITGLAALAGVSAGSAYYVLVGQYDKDGFNKDGINREGYDREGYDRNGYNAKGFDRTGFNVYGYDEDGYDQYGYNQSGYDCEGYDQRGYNSSGYNKQGYDRYGYDENGFDSQGYDCNGFNLNGYNRLCEDISGKKPGEYFNDTIYISMKLKKAKEQLQIGNLSYASLEIRQGLERGINCLIQHYKGEEDMKLDLYVKINIIKKDNIINNKRKSRLHKLRLFCNDSIHEDFSTRSRIEEGIDILQDFLQSLPYLLSI